MASERCECGHGNEEHALRYDLDGPSPCRVCSCNEYRPAPAEPTFPNERDCDHGQLRRQCEICDLKAALTEAQAVSGEQVEFNDSVCDVVWGGECAWEETGLLPLRDALRKMVKRLREERDEARAEVERLKHEVDRAEAAYVPAEQRAEQAEAEVGRLRLKRRDALRKGVREQKRAEQAEADKETLAKWLSSAEAKLLDADAKAERLRAEIRKAEDAKQEAALDAADALLDECERWEREGVIGVGEMNAAINAYRAARKAKEREKTR